ncbi:glutaminyl-peptide cyclotransferase [soil metagenome]
MRLYFLILIAVVSFGCTDNSGSKANGTINKTNSVNMSDNTAKLPVSGFEVVNAYNHDQNAFTQGLIFHDGFLYESTGHSGQSSLRKVELETGKVVQKKEVPEEYFAEGMTILGDKVYQITWQENTAFVYNLSDFSLVKQLRYSGEGWGLTNDGTNLIMSDGTHVIRFVDPETFETLRTIVVLNEEGKPLMRLNELEYVKGEIWANIWQSENIKKPNHIARIDPANGKLLGWINLDNISPNDSGRDYENSLNGIAYDAANDRIFVTGKNWRRLFEIKLKAQS